MTNFIVPQKTGSFIGRVENNKIVIQSTIDVPFQSKSVILKNGLIVSLCFSENGSENNTIKIFDAAAQLLWKKENVSYRAIAFKDNTVYLGGEYSTQYNVSGNSGMFSLMNLDSIHFDSIDIRVPIEQKEGKAIDDILILDESLALVDNIVFPKFIIYYDISEPTTPIYKCINELPNNGTYEHIVKGDISQFGTVLLSATVGQFGSGDHISILDRGCLSTNDSQDMLSSDIKDKYERNKLRNITDICLINENLYFIADKNLMCLKLSSEIKLSNCFEVNTRIKPSIDRLLKTPCGQLLVFNSTAFELIPSEKNNLLLKGGVNKKMSSNQSRISQLREQLLDLTKRNRLLNYPYSEKRGIRLNNTSLSNLYHTLQEKKAITLSPISEPSQKELIEYGYISINEDTEEQLQNKELPNAKQWAKDLGIKENYYLGIPNHSEKHLTKNQTIYFPDDLSARVTHFLRKDKEAANEVGFNICYLVLGFLKWKINKDDDKFIYSPLVILPVKIDKNAKIIKLDQDTQYNVTLKSKLEKEYGLSLPEFPETSSSFIEDYFSLIEKNITTQKSDWSIVPFANICLLNFSTQAMYNDLDLSNWSTTHSLIEDLVSEKAGQETDSGSLIGYGETANIDLIESETHHNEFPIVFDADSSQHTALIDALKGKNLVIEGPPGTGKSQTISNIIAALLASDKKVLFVAEKMTALEVVKHKLDTIGIGDYCFEIHSHKTQKAQVINELKNALNIKRISTPKDLREKIQLFEAEKEKLNKYVVELNEPFGETGLTIQHLLALASRYCQNLPFNPSEYRILDLNKHNFTSVRRKELEQDLVGFLRVFKEVANQTPNQSIREHHWYGVQKTQFNQFEEKELFHTLAQWNNDLKEVFSYCQKVRNNFSLPNTEELSIEEIDKLTNVMSKLPRAEGDELFYLASHVENINHFDVYLKDYKHIHDVKTEQANYFKHDVINTLALNGISVALASLKQIGVNPSDALTDVLGDYRKITCIIKELENIQEYYKSLVDKLPNPIRHLFVLSETSFSELQTFAKYLELPDSLWKLRHNDWKIPEFDENLSKLNDFLPELQQRKKRIADIFDLEKLPNEKILEEVFLHIKKTSLFRIFSSEWHRARKQLNLLKSPAINNLVAIEHFEELIAYRKGITQLNKFTNTDLANSSFQGINTPIEHLVKLRQWYKDILNVYGAAFSDSVAVGEVLTDSDISTVLALKHEVLKTLANINELYEQLHAMAEKYDMVKVLLVSGNKQDWLSDDSPLLALHWKLEESLKVVLEKVQSQTLKVSEVEENFYHLTQLQEILRRWTDNDLNNILQECNYHLSSELGDYDPAKYDVGLRTKKILSILLENKWLIDNFSHSSNLERYEEIKTLNINLSKNLELCRISENEFVKAGNIDIEQWKNVSERLDIIKLCTRNQLALDNVSELSSWIEFVQFKSDLLGKWKIPFLPQTKPYDICIKDYEKAIKAILYNQLSQQAINDSLILKQFNFRTHEESRRRFRELDKEILELRRQAIIADIQKKISYPTGNSRGRVSTYTEFSLIQHVSSQKRPRISVRDLLKRASQTIQSIKPCFMMSPMSVAQYLTPEEIDFDVVIMDEASQIEPVFAFGAIMRAKQCIVVGDPKQLPPTNFFRNTILDTDDDNAVGAEIAESILGAVTPLFKNRQLRWHYRSRHETLIAFSNHQFYDGNLVVFPSPQAESSNLGIKFHRLNNACLIDRRNRIEAEKIIEYLVAHFSSNPNESIGVATMNVTQKSLIEELWDAAIQDTPELLPLIEKNEASDEALFIKNLENVQGDERDIIVISMTYGPQHVGEKVHQRFGPVNTVGGERRLNVLLTRAKKKMVVFSSMGSADITEGGGKGKQALKDFLYYCENKRLSTIVTTGKTPDSDFEIAVIDMLEKEGFRCEPQLGVSGYFIDIAVRNPKNSGHYLMGIECDGATYHSAKSARDRDRLRQEILENQGWEIRRIWSTNWFKNPEAALRPILDDLKIMVEAYSTIPNVEETTEVNLSQPQTAKEKESSLEFLLRQFDKDVIRKCHENTPEENKLLSEEMIKILVRKEPTTPDEFRNKIPYDYRQKISAEEGKFINKVMDIICIFLDG